MQRSTLLKMKVILVSCLVFGIVQATLPGLSGLGGLGGQSQSRPSAASNILPDILGATQGILRFLRENVNRISGGGGGQAVDGTGSGLGGYNYPAPQQSHGQSQQSYRPPQQSYGPPQHQNAGHGQSGQSGYSYPAPAPHNEYLPAQQSSGLGDSGSSGLGDSGSSNGGSSFDIGSIIRYDGRHFSQTVN